VGGPSNSGLILPHTTKVRMSKNNRMSKDANEVKMSKEMMKIVRLRLMGMKMNSAPKVEVKQKMAPSRFNKTSSRPTREVTPFRDEPAPASAIPFRPTTPGPERPVSPVDPARPVTPAPPEWTSYDAPINFTWVIPEELCGMGWPKSRDQVRFLVDQGIDHLVSLSPEKIPPAYAYPNLKHTMIPVEDFTGPTISEIQRFIEITDEARKEGEAVGVHCAEGRGRTGVMCACYLIYYYDMEPWDAIRIMRRQRPGSVERKVQEETVVRFYTLLVDYGKDSVDKLDQREKQLLEMQKKQQSELMRNDALASQRQTMNLLSHMHSFHSKQNGEAKRERVARIRRARSMPKMDAEEEKAANLKNHLQSFLQGDRVKCRPKRTKSQRETCTDGESNDCSDTDRRSRGTTPGRALLEEVSLKPPSERNIKNRLDPPPSQDSKSEFKNHFHTFMKTPATVKRGRSFSQPRGKEGEAGSGGEGSLSRGESFKQELSPQQQERQELENHTKRFLQRKSLIRPIKHSDESGDDSLSLSVTHSSSKTADKESRDSCSCSDDELESSPVSNVVLSKPPLSKPVAETNGAFSSLRPVVDRRRRGGDTEVIGVEEDANIKLTVRRFDRRQRSKSDITGLVSAGLSLQEEKEEEVKKEEKRKKEEEEKEEERKKEKEEREKKEEDRKKISSNGLNYGTDQPIVRGTTIVENRQKMFDSKIEKDKDINESFTASKTEYSTLVDDDDTATVEEQERSVQYCRTETSDEQYSTVQNIETSEEIPYKAVQCIVTEVERPMIRKIKVYASTEYQPVDMSSSYAKIGNSVPRPFSVSRQTSQVSAENEDNCASTPPPPPPTSTISETGGGPPASQWGIPGSVLLSPPSHEKKEKERSPKYSTDNKENRKSQTKEIRNRSEQRRNELQGESDLDQPDVDVEKSESKRDSSNTSTSDILAACKSGLRRLTYRKIYSRTRSNPLEEGQEEETKSRPKSGSSTMSPQAPDRATRYITVNSGSRIPNRPTTPGPYFGVDRGLSPGPHRPYTPTPGPTSPSISRESWKRTNQKFNYSRYSKYGTHETFV